MQLFIQMFSIVLVSVTATFTDETEIKLIGLKSADNDYIKTNFNGSTVKSVDVLEDLTDILTVDYTISDDANNELVWKSGLSFCGADNGSQDGSIISILKTFLGPEDNCIIPKGTKDVKDSWNQALVFDFDTKCVKRITGISLKSSIQEIFNGTFEVLVKDCWEKTLEG